MNKEVSLCAIILCAMASCTTEMADYLNHTPSTKMRTIANHFRL